jgi:hypothetical protein
MVGLNSFKFCLDEAKYDCFQKNYSFDAGDGCGFRFGFSITPLFVRKREKDYFSILSTAVCTRD